MKTNNLCSKFLLASLLLALVFTNACGVRFEINEPTGQALLDQGNALMNNLKDKDFHASYDMMSTESRRAFDIANVLVAGIVDLKEEIMQSVYGINEWKFDSTQIYTEHGKKLAVLEGWIRNLDGKKSILHLEFELQDGIWKVRNFNMNP